MKKPAEKTANYRTPDADGPGAAGPSMHFAAGAMGYSRIQVCSRQMKARQPDTPSLSGAIIFAFDL